MTFSSPTVSEIRTAKRNAVGGDRKRCRKGKNCSAACSNSGMACLVDLPEPVQKSIPQAINEIEKANKRMGLVTQAFNSYKTEEETIKWLGENYKKLATEGMERGRYGAPGQRGTPNSKIWVLGQEGGMGEDQAAWLTKSREKNDPVRAINVLRLHHQLYDAARKEIGDKQMISQGVEDFLVKKPFHLGNNITIEDWVKYPPQTYYGRLGRIFQELGYSGDLGAPNISSLMQPAGQKVIPNIIEMLKKNGVDVNTFANGAFKNKEAWYLYSAKERAPLILKGMRKFKPELMYIGQQSGPQAKTFGNTLLYTLAKQTGGTVYHVKNGDKDYKYLLIRHPGGKQTVILNAWHPTGQFHGGAGAFEKQKTFAKNLIQSLAKTGKLPEGVSANQIDQSTQNKVLGVKTLKTKNKQPKTSEKNQEASFAEPTRSAIRTAKRNAVGGGRKRCRKGKNCSAACIQAGMVCLVEMPEEAGVALTKMRDSLQSGKEKTNISSSLTGDALLARLRELTGQGVTDKVELAKQTGYTDKSGKMDAVQFMTAIQQAKAGETSPSAAEGKSLKEQDKDRAKRYENEAKRAGLDRHEKKALKDWTTTEVDDNGMAVFQRINDALRSGEDEWSLRDQGENKTADQIQLMDRALNKLPANSRRDTFYRALRFDRDDDYMWEDFASLKKGDTFYDPGFSSYSASKSKAKDFYNAYGGGNLGDRKVLFVSKNPSLVPINAFAAKGVKDEMEALAPRGDSSTVSWVKKGSDPGGGEVLIIGLDYE